MLKVWINFQDLGWSSDWNGDEVGYDDVDVVGLYMLNGTDYGFYINMETMQILECLYFGEEDY